MQIIKNIWTYLRACSRSDKQLGTYRSQREVRGCRLEYIVFSKFISL